MPDAARDIEQFLFHEARLLDQQRYEDWLALYAEDATYWVPLEQGQRDAIETSSIVRDDKTLLALRVRQARHPRAHARLPLARTVHQVATSWSSQRKMPRSKSHRRCSWSSSAPKSSAFGPHW